MELVQDYVQWWWAFVLEPMELENLRVLVPGN
jgi:hypothetical protein